MNKQIIAEIYKELTGKIAKQTNCRQCWEDYLIEIQTIMAKKKKAGQDVAKIASKVEKAVGKETGKTFFNGKRGFELYPFYQIMVAGRVYNSRTLTDKAAKDYLKAGGNRSFFKTIPALDSSPVTVKKEATAPIKEVAPIKEPTGEIID